MIVCIDPGHGSTCVNGGSGYLEHAGMWKLSNYLKAALERCKIEAILTRTETSDPSWVTRGYTARGCDLFISEHSNAASGTARGVEAYYSLQVPSDKRLAAAITAAEAAAMNSIDRGAKTKESTESNFKGSDYYTVMYAAREVRCPHVLLVESGFHDNAADVEFLKNDDFLWLLAQIQCQEICTFFGIEYISEDNAADKVISSPTATRQQAETWAHGKGATETFISLAKKYYDLSQSHGGVNPLLAFVQAVLETGYGKFLGVLDESYCNPCGMKTASGGSDEDNNAHQRFTSWDEGVKAHLDHLALYAGANGYPRSATPDPRHFPSLAGKGSIIITMSKSWCPTKPDYAGTLKRMIKEVENTAVPQGNIKIRGQMHNLPMKNKDGYNYATVKDIAEIMPDLTVSVRKILEDAGYTVGWDDADKVIVVS